MEYFRADRDDLFLKFDFHALAHSRDKQISDAVNLLGEDYVLNVNEEEYVNYLIEEYTLSVPVIHFEDARIEPRKVLVEFDQPSHWMTSKAIERNVIRYIIPIEGDANLLNCRPSSFLISGFGLFHYSSGRIYTDIMVADGDPERVNREFEDRKDSFSKMIGFLQKDICSYNNSLPETASNIFFSKKERIIQDNRFLAGLGTPTIAQAGTPRTYSVPTVTRRYAQPEGKQSVKAIEELTPVMNAQRYTQILDAIQTVGKMFESLPNVTKGMDEETLRDLFLAQIQTSFKSEAAIGEAFNKNGKTDILVKRGDEIVFIAECKFWKGKQVLLDAISQLLSYLTWRDTKTALLIFIRGTSMSAAVSSVKENVVTHPNYKSTETAIGETWFNYRFSMVHDQDRDVYLAIQLFDFTP